MQANWSLILNILLLVGVIVAIVRMIKVRRQSMRPLPRQPSIGEVEKSNFDDIIVVRKVNQDVPVADLDSQIPAQPKIPPVVSPVIQDSQKAKVAIESPLTVMIFLLAKENRQLAGYELLQTVLAAGLRFGEGHLFHRHQYPNGQGPVLCSLAAATASGVFDLQNIGAFVVKGLCLFMQASGNATIDAERFEIMLDTAKQLSEGLDTHLLDDKQRPLTDASVQRYHRVLNISETVGELID